jgi:hypothetical protein
MMRSIQMVDLKNQYLRLKPEIDLAMAEVVESAAFINGPAVKRFSDSLSSYLGGAYVVPCANGTDALQIAMMALNLKPGSEVILPAFTYAATAEVIALLHLKPILVDVHPQTFLIDTSKIETAITPQTKAIVPVHLFGQCADMEFIVNIARKHNLVVIEDAAQAIGSEYTFSDGTRKQSGTIGDVGCTSFFPSKNLGCMGDGGAMFTENEELAKRLKMIANHGQSVQYHHDDIGVNSRLDTLQAAVLDIKLKHLDFLYNLTNTSGVVMNSGGVAASYNVGMRGFSAFGKAGYLIPFTTRNPNSGLMILAGAGVYYHKINISTPQNDVPTLTDDLKKGYDRLSMGPALTQFIGYSYHSHNRYYNFFIGFDFMEAFTQSVRGYNYDTMRPDTEKRTDITVGGRIGWMIPIYLRTKNKDNEYEFR